MESHPVLPALDRLAGDERGETFDRVRLPDDEGRLLVESGGGEINVPIEPRRIGRKLGDGAGIISLVHIFARRPIEMRGGDLGFKSHDPRCSRGRIAYAGKFEQVAHVGLIGGAMFCHLRFVGKVIFAVGHAESALQKIRDGAGGIAQRLRDEEAEQVFRPKVGGVQRIDIGTKLLAKRTGEIGFRFDFRDPGEPLLERIETTLLDSGRVHVSRVIVGDHSLRCACCRFAGTCFANQIGVPLLRFLKDLKVHTGARTIGRYFGLLAPGAIRVFLEVVARFCGEVAQREIDPDRLFRRRRSSEKRRRRQRHQCDRSKKLFLHAIDSQISL